MRQLIFTIILTGIIFPLLSIGNPLTIKKIMVYPPIYLDSSIVLSDNTPYLISEDSALIISNDRENFAFEYLKKAAFLRYPLNDPDSINELYNLLTKLQFVKDLEYSNKALPTLLKIDSVGHLFWNTLTPPIIGQIFISNNDGFDVIWLTTDGVEIDGKLYRYSTELREYFIRIRDRRLYDRRIK